MSIKLITENIDGARIKVVGIGGGGGNIVDSMVDKGIEGVEFIAINTDSQALHNSKAHIKICIGKNITHGLGTGMQDDLALRAVEESRDEIERVLANSDMIFITAGMGGGTGTGASPAVAHIAKGIGALVVAIVTKPFHFEGKQRMELAIRGLEKLKKEVDSLIVIPNEKILELIGEDTEEDEAFGLADRVLYNATKGISQIITKTGKINSDFADVRTIMKDSGDAMIGAGLADGPDRADKAANEALSNPLLDEIDIQGSKCVLVNIVHNGKMKFKEIEKINMIIQKAAGYEAKYILGIVRDPEMKDAVMVTVIATGFRNKKSQLNAPPFEPIDDNNFAATGTDDYNPTIYTIPENPSDLDPPAYVRRKIDINDDISDKKRPQSDKQKDNNTSDDELYIDEEEYKKPAFLRKQMD